MGGWVGGSTAFSQGTHKGQAAAHSSGGLGGSHGPGRDKEEDALFWDFREESFNIGAG
ncbi:hypothetical protein E2C01_079295 [Portunus trituberculatus]|uniref:Uncharacterized protein n=1 Tax=Portunus trituberculatus TaxID=210409 RepID=A0A5B7IPY0_PORTR|nr:hypothetical protein [Portunus trituberculatus]